jgi:hypothetical protein
MTLSTLYMMQMNASAMQTGTAMPDKLSRDILYTLVVLMVLDLVFLFYAIYCLVDCSQNQSFPPYLTILLFILMFVPGLGFAVALGIIVYHLAIGCGKRSKLAFAFF